MLSYSGTPFHLTLIDGNRFAVTYAFNDKIEIINLSTTHVQTITLEKYCHGISYTDGKLYVMESTIGIVVLDLTGKILKTVPLDTEHLCNIATSRDRIYYTNEHKNTIHRLSLTGQVIWEYHNKSIIQPLGITVSDNQDVLVVGSTSNNLSIITQNGNKSRILLDKFANWITPRTVYYNRDRK
ncbi:Hypothetical predicted protein [Mytilus galloprovincialis]|uniref:Uncharacterized protein n=1 Tax=Mytilus galloprovincialis TaxID=29158 RepID=A0A8B6H534_MYTGA|nr:Hypothetical predicted protein [Mytilus galloprovincialis]